MLIEDLVMNMGHFSLLKMCSSYVMITKCNCYK